MILKYEHLLGKQYVPGQQHCYQLCREFFQDNFGIELTDYAVPHDWDSDQINLIEMIYEREGFEKVQDWTIRTLRPADVLCVSVRSGNPNHFVINLDGNNLLHHPLMQLSRVDPMRDYWRMSTCYVLRHPAVPEPVSELTPTTLKELADARYSPQASA